MEEKNVLLRVENLKMYFPAEKSMGGTVTKWVKAVDDVSFDVEKGKTFGLVGESGCGKTTTGKCILRINKATEGRIIYKGKDLAAMPQSEFKKQRREIQLIFQDPYGSLNPRQSCGTILRDAIRLDGKHRSKKELDERVEQLLKTVELLPEMKDRYPHEFSGGQRQRLCIARAVALDPELLICDEAVSALDLSIRAQVLDLLADLKRRLSLSVIFITHDLGVVRHIADRVLVMHRGRIVEQGTCDEVLRNPKEEYTRYLMASVPKIGKPLV